VSEVVLKASQLHKSFVQGETKISILKGLDLEVVAGESVAILGRSGSGKSTLLSLLSGLDRADQGELFFSSHSYHNLTESELTQLRGHKMGIIFQQFHLLPHLSALENISLPLEILKIPEAQKRAQESLNSVGLYDRANHLPGKLSGGEKQRVAIARAMVVNPQLLLADEPSGSLDEATGLEVMQLIFELVKSNGMSMILVTHSEELAAKCDKVFRLDDGILKRVS